MPNHPDTVVTVEQLESHDKAITPRSILQEEIKKRFLRRVVRALTFARKVWVS
jgi:hypothetical protein